MSWKSLVRRQLERLLHAHGYGLRRLDAPPRGYARFLELYRSVAPAPRHVIDVGVGDGTPWLYEAFPEAHLILVEPLREFEPAIRGILERRAGQCHLCCLAESDGEAVIEVHPWNLTGSSLLKTRSSKLLGTAGGVLEQVERRIVPQRRLDSIAAGLPGPCVMKIDVEGAELGVLRGAVRTLGVTDLILLETSLLERHAGSPDLIDVGLWLKKQGFRLFEIVEIATVGSRRISSYVDAAFLRADGEAYRKLTEG